MKCPLTRLSSLPVILSEVSQVLSHLRISYQIFMRNILFLRVINKGGVKRDSRGFVVTFMTYEMLVIKAMDWITIPLVTLETKEGITRRKSIKQSNKVNSDYDFGVPGHYKNQNNTLLWDILNYIHVPIKYSQLQ